MSPAPTLAFDIGGTKLAAALVDGVRIVERRERATRRRAGADGWVEDMGALAAHWRGRFAAVGVAATGLVREGLWSALNPATLDIADDYPLVAALERRVGARVFALNDAQAACWGEYRFGAGDGRDCVFLTVSTGVGGGIVAGDRLLEGSRGLAGHVGRIPCREDETPPGAARPDGTGPAETGRSRDAREDGRADDRGPRASRRSVPFESRASGAAIAAAAARLGRATDARGVFAAAAAGERWAEAIVDDSAACLARLCETLQAVVDPERVVVGGGVGLADGYLERVERALAPCTPRLRPALVRAALGADAGLTGVADLARRRFDLEGETTT